MREFTSGFLFCGLGAGALGFLRSCAQLGGATARFRSLGGVDIDPEACADFEMLTGSPALCADLATLTPGELRGAWGNRRPDVIFSSPPCKGFSGLLSNRVAQSEKYQALNRLVLQGLFLACETWSEPPPLIVLENVPRIQSRGAHLLRQVRQLLAGYGYVFHEGTHDCGEIGGLAQHRRRYLLVARRPADVPSFVYQPPRQRVKAIGEVLEKLPLPEDPGAGPLHTLPRLSWLTWLRLALIPAGGDWRDLPRVVPEGAERRSVWARCDVRGWYQSARTVAGEGSNGGFDVVALRSPSRPNLFGVRGWDQPALTVTGSASVSGSNGAAAVADPRIPEWHKGILGVRQWNEPSGTVTGSAAPSRGAFALADPRELALGCAPRAGAYGVLSWEEAARTITGSMAIDNGRAAVADPRPPGDHRYPIIIAADGTWHRPLTPLELAALQGIPTVIYGRPLELAGRRRSGWIERIGNAVPVGAAQAIGDQLLRALLAAALETWTLGSTPIWVQEEEAA